MKEILPGLKILIKDCTLNGWKNAQMTDPSLVVYEDLLKKFPNLSEYYNHFPEREIHLIASPKTDKFGDVIPNDRETSYWKQHEVVFKFLSLSKN